MKFLLIKVNEIIETINSHLPPTQIEEVSLNIADDIRKLKLDFLTFLCKIMNSNFKQPFLILFNTNDLQFELEEDVGVELFLDNLKLHKLNLESSDKENGNKHKHKHLCSRYLRKIAKILVQWDQRIHGSGANIEQHDIQ